MIYRDSETSLRARIDELEDLLIAEKRKNVKKQKPPKQPSQRWMFTKEWLKEFAPIVAALIVVLGVIGGFTVGMYFTARWVKEGNGEAAGIDMDVLAAPAAPKLPPGEPFKEEMKAPVEDEKGKKPSRKR